MKLLCLVAKVSRSGYYRYLKTAFLPDKDASLIEKIRGIQEEVYYSYGSKRMAHKLAEEVGVPVNHKRVARIMSEQLLGARSRRRRHPDYWYRERHKERLSDRQCSPNLLNRDFSSDKPDTKLVTDVTWVACAAGTLYLSAIMDLYNHEIVAYEISQRNTTKTVLAPVLKLLSANELKGALLHCDRGPAYRSEEYQTLLKVHKIVSSYSRPGNCWDNAVMECFFGQLKSELGYVNGSTKRQSFQNLAREIKEYIKFYNEQRIQKHLAWLSPVEYRKRNAKTVECVLT